MCSLTVLHGPEHILYMHVVALALLPNIFYLNNISFEAMESTITEVCWGNTMNVRVVVWIGFAIHRCPKQLDTDRKHCVLLRTYSQVTTHKREFQSATKTLPMYRIIMEKTLFVLTIHIFFGIPWWVHQRDKHKNWCSCHNLSAVRIRHKVLIVHSA